MPSTPSSPPLSPARELLRRFALAWAGAALNGTQRRDGGADPAPEIAFADPFAGRDHPLPTGRLPLPLAVAERLLGHAARGVDPARVRCLLLEEDPVKVEWLAQGARRAGLGELLGRCAGTERWPAAPLALRECDATPHDALAAELAEIRAGLLVLDPATAAHLPWEALRTLASLPAVEIVLRFPTTEIRRLERCPPGPLADLPPLARRSVEGVSRLLGDARHGWFLAWRASGPGADPLPALLRALGDRLRSETGRSVRHLRLPLGAEAADLFLVGASAGAPLGLNELLFQGRCEGWIPWPEPGPGLVRFPEPEDLELFGGEAGGGRRERYVDRTLLAHTVAERFAGRTVPLAAVLEEMAAEPELVLDDLRRALLELRRDGRALFRSLGADDAVIAFPSRRLRGAGPTRRRRSAEPELTLSLDPESE